MSDLVQLTKDNEIAVITINNPPVNALSPGVPEGIAAAVEAFGQDKAVQAIVLIGGGKTFVAGADIKEFGKMTSARRAAECGACRAAALKIAEADRDGDPWHGVWRRARAGDGGAPSRGGADAQVGQPEVKLGIIPGAGGTQRLAAVGGSREGRGDVCVW